MKASVTAGKVLGAKYPCLRNLRRRRSFRRLLDRPLGPLVDLRNHKPGTFKLSLLSACDPPAAGAEVTVSVGDSPRPDADVQNSPSTKSWRDFKPFFPGAITLPVAGKYTLTLTPKTKPGEAVMNLRTITLMPVKSIDGESRREDGGKIPDAARDDHLALLLRQLLLRTHLPASRLPLGGLSVGSVYEDQGLVC